MLVLASVIVAALATNDPAGHLLLSPPACQHQRVAEVVPAPQTVPAVNLINPLDGQQKIATGFKLRSFDMMAPNRINPCCPGLGCCPKDK